MKKTQRSDIPFGYYPTTEVCWARATLEDHNKVPTISMMGHQYKLVQKWTSARNPKPHYVNVERNLEE